MPAVTLRHYSAPLTTTSLTVVATVTPTARALVISKILVSAVGSSTITLYAGSNLILNALAMTNGQVYTETGIVLVAGEQFSALAGTASQIYVHVFGEETDN